MIRTETNFQGHYFDQKYLTIQRQALIKLRIALNETLDNDKLQDHFTDYESSVEAFKKDALEEVKNKKRKGRSNQESQTKKRKTTSTKATSSSNQANKNKKLLVNGYCSNNESWEALEYLGDRVLTSCLLKIAGPRYIKIYKAQEIKKGVHGKEASC
ncbi:13730_t:CDS:2 [Dentiscutata erythropus]|uniref:13730_t:CDS:1 n=1 Tax=Dentiscutata erythropus TaxID=1348616 RepID=A0A9N9ALW6_9GLOM|nr:13730_t:CDS:2 [Dentiscutata erythropus]